MFSYCEFSKDNVIHGPYHDREYGFPVDDESELFERLLLEINQAGLSWELILKKREGFRVVYSRFDVDKVAAYGEEDRARLPVPHSQQLIKVNHPHPCPRHDQRPPELQDEHSERG